MKIDDVTDNEEEFSDNDSIDLNQAIKEFKRNFDLSRPKDNSNGIGQIKSQHSSPN